MPPEERIHALKTRLDDLLIKQVNEFGADYTRGGKAYSPFPLAVMTCVGIEALGQMFYRQLSLESQKEPFIAVAKRIDQKFSRQLKKEFKEAFGNRWNKEDISKLQNAAQVLYVYFRNTMVHGYFGKGVGLTDLSERETDDLTFGDGYLVLNPYWFWKEFEKVYSKLFDEARQGDRNNNPRWISCLEYLQEILS